MYIENTLKSWEQFVEKLNSDITNNPSLKSDFSPYFRGQCDAEWSLQTTLERYFPNKNYSSEEYYKILETFKPEIEARTSKKWKLPKFSKKEALDLPPTGYDFMVYCRHHGIPSPLLDWSKSPYVASYFAFAKAEEKKNVSISVFMPTFNEKLDNYYADIFALGPRVNSNTDRHDNQQSVYTLCLKLNDEVDGEDVFYAKYTDTCCNSQLSGKLTKYTIPGKEKNKVLRKLDSMKINKHSLFKSDDGLMSTLDCQHIFLP